MNAFDRQKIPVRPDVAALHDSSTGSVQYVASAPTTCYCVIVDPVLDNDEKSGAIANCNADRLLDPILKLAIQTDHLVTADGHEGKTVCRRQWTVARALRGRLTSSA